MAISDEGHEVHELNVVGGRARLRALQHDRAERAGGDDGAGASVLQLPEPYVADSAPRLFFLVGEQHAAARATAERVVAVANRLFEVHGAGTELCEQLPRLFHRSRIASQITGI